MIRTKALPFLITVGILLLGACAPKEEAVEVEAAAPAVEEAAPARRPFLPPIIHSA